MAGFGWEVIAIGASAALFAGISKGGFGSGAAFLGAAILALFVPPGQALGIMLPLLLVIDAATLRPYWRQWDSAGAKQLLLGALPGVLLGAGLYQVADADVFRLIIGLVCVLFVAWRVWPGQAVARSESMPGWAGAVLGALAGFTSYVSHAGGPAVAVYLLSKGIGKTRYQATTVLVFGVLNVVKAGLYGAQGLFTPATLWLDLWLVPFALAGAWLGVVLHRRVAESWFFGITYVVLVLTGLRLIQVALA